MQWSQSGQLFIVMLCCHLLHGIIFWIILYWKVCILVSLTVLNSNLNILGQTFGHTLGEWAQVRRDVPAWDVECTL